MTTSSTVINPYGSEYSSYSEVLNEELVYAEDQERNVSGEALLAYDSFQKHVLNSEFPCLGAKASLHGNFYRYGFYETINSLNATQGLAHDLWNYARDERGFSTNYATFIACFRGPKTLDEGAWEDILWQQLQSLHECDRSDWDDTVSSDPEDSHFSFSFAGTGFFIVGLHDGASRLSRKFGWPTLVFNVHSQFERLRDEGLFERMQETIRVKDRKLQGTLNPNLSDFGKQSEVKQYSGRAVEAEWKCPFHRLFGRFMKSPHN